MSPSSGTVPAADTINEIDDPAPHPAAGGVTGMSKTRPSPPQSKIPVTQ